MGHHVMAIDYRGYGDSTWLSPSETSMVADAKAAYDFLVQRVHPSTNIFIWGHSLGTGVTSKLSHDLSIDDSRSLKPKGIILEAPFNCMLDEVETFKLAGILPYLGIQADTVLSQADMSFDSARWLKGVKEVPILIMHAEDDNVIPFSLARKLYDEIRQASGIDVQFQGFQAEEQLGHDGIYKAQGIVDIITGFVNRTIQ